MTAPKLWRDGEPIYHPDSSALDNDKSITLLSTSSLASHPLIYVYVQFVLEKR